MSDETKPTSWWRTTVGSITATATALTACVGAFVALKQSGLLPAKNSTATEQGSNSNDAAAAAAADDGGLQAGVARNANGEIRDSRNPLPATLGTTYKLTLDEREETYLTFVAPGPVKLVFDIRLPKGEHSNLQSRIEVLDADGASRATPVNLNVIDAEHRVVGPLPLKRGERTTLKIVNGRKLAEMWLTLQPQDEAPFVPLFGTIVPRPIAPGQAVAGTLGLNEYAYFAVALKKGTYKAILDLTNSDIQETNIQSNLALLDADGGDYRPLLRVNEMGPATSANDSFILTRDRTVVVRVHNGIHSVDYRVRVIPA